MRDYPQMARVAAMITDVGIRLTTDGMPDLEVVRPTYVATSDRVTHVQLWRRSAPAIHATRDADDWLTRAIGVSCRLMSFLPDPPALNVPPYEVHSSLLDATPFHLTTEKSFADLNARMEAPIPMNRFRPNLVMRGTSLTRKDLWRTIAMGETALRWIKP
jgi:uncharacterized protein YcbX